MAVDPMSDSELAGYADIHCETPRALFHKSHVIQLYKMAGLELHEELLNEFEALYSETVKPLLKTWRERNG